MSEGGALLGTRRTLPEKDLAKCAENLKKFDIQVFLTSELEMMIYSVSEMISHGMSCVYFNKY